MIVIIIIGILLITLNKVIDQERDKEMERYKKY